MTTQQNISLPRGDTHTFEIHVVNSTRSWQLVDLSNQVLILTVKSDNTDSDAEALLQKRSVLPDNAESKAGRCRIVLSANDTNIRPGRYLYDIQLSVPGSPPLVSTLLFGFFTITADVTRSAI